MLSKKLQTELNQQVNKEFYSAYLYLGFANHYEDETLPGFANWYRIQAQEERDHAMLFIQYLQMNHASVTLEAIDKPEIHADALIDPLEAGYQHEQYVTSLIHHLYAIAFDEKDFRTMQFLDWFIKEQGEEENNAKTLIDKMKLFGKDPKGLYLLNEELNTRTYTPPSLVLA